VTGVVILCVAVVLTLAAGLVHRSRDGRLRDSRARPGSDPASALQAPSDPAPDRAPDDLRPLLAAVGAVPGERATLLQFSSAFCAPCRATRRVLGEVSDLVEGVSHVEVDAEQHLDVVRLLGIAKTPTTLVLDAGGREVKRASGQPRKADVLAALGHALP
jgi:thiol-disulfide isomerase/thioredoxin